jgi:Spy/CpxP family protein refolding chaperone
MEFNSDRIKAAALVALVFVLGVAFGVVGVLAGRHVLSAARPGNNGQGQQGQQISQLVHALNLTPDQEKQLRQTLADTRDRYDAIRRQMEPQMRQLQEQSRDSIRGILTAEQRTEFEQFRAESRNHRSDQNNRRGNQGSRGGQNASNSQGSLVKRMTQELRLTAGQQTQLSGILRDTRTKLDALRQQMDPQFEEVRLQNRERLRQIVTPEQRQGLEDFFQRRDQERRRK